MSGLPFHRLQFPPAASCSRNSMMHGKAVGHGPLASSSAVREYYKKHITVFTVLVFHTENTTIKNNFSIQA